jgi:hypothetical protein
MLDDHRRKAVAAVGDFSHRASLPSASLLTKPTGMFGSAVFVEREHGLAFLSPYGPSLILGVERAGLPDI